MVLDDATIDRALATWNQVTGQKGDHGSAPDPNTSSTNQTGIGSIQQQIVYDPNNDQRWPIGFSYPNRVTGVLDSVETIGGQAYDNQCSMFLIGPSTALGAAHCFYNPPSNPPINPGDSPVGWYPAARWAFGVSTASGPPMLQRIAFEAVPDPGCLRRTCARSPAEPAKLPGGQRSARWDARGRVDGGGEHDDEGRVCSGDGSERRVGESKTGPPFSVTA
jgi:hypothetical protein